MTGMTDVSIRQVRVSYESMAEKLSDMLEFLQLEPTDLILLKITVEKIDGNPTEWLMDKYGIADTKEDE